MSFQKIGLDNELIGKLDEFYKKQDFVTLYSSYTWRKDIRAAGFPDILDLELRLKKSDQTTGITLSDVKAIAKWGKLRNPRRISGSEIVLPKHSFTSFKKSTVEELSKPPLSLLDNLDKSITRGVGPTYYSKILRFALPQQYGAIDTRIVNEFGVSGQRWLKLRVMGGSIYPKNDKWEMEYGKWIKILSHFTTKLENSCPHPQQFIDKCLRKKGVWKCADVEMALFSYASKKLNKRGR